jgi:hypothetical protein
MQVGAIPSSWSRCATRSSTPNAETATVRFLFGVTATWLWRCVAAVWRAAVALLAKEFAEVGSFSPFLLLAALQSTPCPRRRCRRSWPASSCPPETSRSWQRCVAHALGLRLRAHFYHTFRVVGCPFVFIVRSVRHFRPVTGCLRHTHHNRQTTFLLPPVALFRSGD